MPKFSANLSMMFGELPFLERFAAAADAGFKAVEFWFPYEYEARDIAERLRRNGLRCVLLNSPPGDMAAGDRGIAIFQHRIDEFHAGIALALQYADKLDCPNVHILAGECAEQTPKADYQRVYEDNLRFACATAAKFDKRVLIEPLNPIDRPHYLLSSQAQAHDIVARLGLENLYVQMDLYHVQMSEGNIAHKLQRYRQRIGHIQIADVPGRHEPGTGEINFRFLFDWIDRLGYRGWIGCEYQPRTSTAEGLYWLAEHGLKL